MTRRWTRSAWLGALIAWGGCGLAPPPALEVAHPELGRAFPEDQARFWHPPALGVAPPALSYRDPATALYAAQELELPLTLAHAAEFQPDQEPGSVVQPVEQDAESAASPAPYSWGTPELDQDRLQARLTELLAWSLYDWLEPARRQPVIPFVAPDVPDEAPAQAEGETRQDYEGRVAQWRAQLNRSKLRLAGEDEGVGLVAHLEILENRVSWVRRSTIAWWGSMILFWNGVLPAHFIPDEIWAADLKARFTLLPTRSGEPLFRREYSVHHERILNDWERGFHFSDLFWLQPYLLDAEDGDYEDAYQLLYPHAEHQLLKDLVLDLRRDLPALFDKDDVRRLLRVGTPNEERTYAVLIGVDDPPPWAEVEGAGPADRPVPLRSAGSGAEDLHDTLVSSKIVREKEPYLALFSNTPGVRQRLADHLSTIGGRLLQNDRLIFYFAGFGTTDPEGRPALVLDDGLLPLAELADQCVTSLPNNPKVVFLLDTSFGSEQHPQGRNYRWRVNDPGGPPPAEALKPLVRGDRWTVLVAADPAGTAFELEDGGIFTRELVAALESRRTDADGDGWISVGEALEACQDGIERTATKKLGHPQEPVLAGVAETRLIPAPPPD